MTCLATVGLLGLMGFRHRRNHRNRLWKHEEKELATGDWSVRQSHARPRPPKPGVGVGWFVVDAGENHSPKRERGESKPEA